MRRLKELPPVAIAKEDYQYLEETCARLLSEARREAQGRALYYPQAGAEGEWRLRDFCRVVEYAGQLLPAEEIAAGIDYLLERQREDGVLPDRIGAEGRPEWEAEGREPPLDTAMLGVKLLDAYFRHSGDAQGFMQRAPRLYRALEAVPLSEDALVYADPNRPRATWGFADAVAMTGKVLMCSLLYWEACKRLALRLQELEDHEEARVWYEAANATGPNLEQFYDEPMGMYWAASQDCRQLEVWGSAYAALIRVASKREARLLGRLLVEQRASFFWKGHLRHLPRGEHWEKLREEVPPETYQNGGYWAAPAGWAVQVVALVDAQAARELIGEVLAVWREDEVYECISPYAPPRGAGCVTSAACLLGATRPEK